MKIRVTSVIFTKTEIIAIRVRPEYAVYSVVQFRSSDDLHYGLEVEKIDFLEFMLIFNFCPEMNKNAYIFHFSLPFLFLAFPSYILS